MGKFSRTSAPWTVSNMLIDHHCPWIGAKCIVRHSFHVFTRKIVI